jgi:hypothetical protein
VTKRDSSTVRASIRAVAALALIALPISGFGAAWESSKEAESFRKGDVASVKRILQKVTYSEPLILEAFPTAVSSGNVELVKYLASLGWLEVCRKDRYCQPIHVAAQYGRVDTIRYLMAQGFDAHAVTPPTTRGEGGKNSALHLAAGIGHIGAVMLLCEQGVDANLKNEYGKTALGDAKYTAGTGSLGATKKEDARIRANVAKVIEYLESGQCKKK